jgi:hypothetical protein
VVSDIGRVRLIMLLKYKCVESASWDGFILVGGIPEMAETGDV